VVGLPLMVQAAKAAIASVDPAVENAARTLGSTELEIFRRITLPLARRGIIAGVLLGAARAFGEFGATLMVAGSIPGRTQTVPLAIYDAVQAGRYADARALVLLTTVLVFASILVVQHLEPQGPGPRRPHAGRAP
jgi:molybdate transport system permease protein